MCEKENAPSRSRTAKCIHRLCLELPWPFNFLLRNPPDKQASSDRSLKLFRLSDPNSNGSIAAGMWNVRFLAGMGEAAGSLLRSRFGSCTPLACVTARVHRAVAMRCRARSASSSGDGTAQVGAGRVEAVRARAPSRASRGRWRTGRRRCQRVRDGAVDARHDGLHPMSTTADLPSADLLLPAALTRICTRRSSEL